jgi:hypothetical protein
MSLAKKSFYPSEEVESLLEAIPKGQISSRINELILKGLTLEHQEKIKADYERFSAEIANESPRKKDKSGISTTMMMSRKAFEAEDEIEDWF